MSELRTPSENGAAGPSSEAAVIFAELRSYIGLSEEDTRILRELGPRMAPFLDEMTERFYEFILANEVVASIIQRGGHSIPSLRRRLERWASDLFSGPYDGDYAERLVTIGHRHVQIGVEARFTAAAFNVVRGYFEQKLFELFEDSPREDLQQALVAMARILDLNLCLVNEAYHRKQRRELLEEKHEEQRRLAERLQALTNAEHILVLSLNAEGRITSFNRMCERLSGFAASDVIDRSYAEIFVPVEERQRFERLLGLCFRTWTAAGSPVLAAQPWRTRSGEMRLVTWFPTQLHDAGGRPNEAILLGHDVTEGEALQKHMLHQEKMVAAGLLAAGVAHEVGNPLASISSVAQTLQRKVADPYVHEKLALIGRHIQRISNTVRQMVDFARPPRVEWDVCSVNAILQNTVNLLAYDKRSTHVAVELDLDPTIPETNAVQDKLGQVFFNIAANALDALDTPIAGRSPRLVMSTRLAHGMEGPEIEIVFEDNGSGIPADTVGRIFEPFFTTKEVGRGTGLGLSVSYRIIADHGGRIDVDGRPGVGARFVIRLPIRKKPLETP